MACRLLKTTHKDAVMARNAIQPSFDFFTGEERSPPRQALRETFRQSTATVARSGACCEVTRSSYEADHAEQIWPMSPYALS